MLEEEVYDSLFGASAKSLATKERTDELRVLIESQRNRHSVQGNIYYVSPNSGDTAS